MTARRTLIAAAIVMAVAACGGPPSAASSSPASSASPAGTGVIVVAFEPRDAPSQVFNGSAHVRVVADGGVIVADRELTAGVAMTVPAGRYGVEVLFIYVSDWMSCIPDPAASGKASCFPPSLSPVPGCAAADVLVAPDATVSLRHRIEPDGSCRLAPAT